MLDTEPKPTPKMSSRQKDPYRDIAQVKNDSRFMVMQSVHLMQLSMMTSNMW